MNREGLDTKTISSYDLASYLAPHHPDFKVFTFIFRCNSLILDQIHTFQTEKRKLIL